MTAVGTNQIQLAVLKSRKLTMARRSKAAKEVEYDVDDLLAEIRNDVKFKKFLRVVKDAQTRLNIEADRNEALALHSTRPSSTLHGKKRYDGHALLEAEAADMSSRARLVTIRVKASIHLDLLGEACDAIKRHILTNYQEQMRMFSNEQQRRALIERVQTAAMNLITEGNSLLNMIDLILKDIDQANFHLGHMQDLLNLLANSKGKTL